MAGFLGKLFGKGNSTKKYEDIFWMAHYRVGQSVEYAFQQAVYAAVNDGVFEDQLAAAEKLYEILRPRVEAEDSADLPALDKAKARIK